MQKLAISLVLVLLLAAACKTSKKLPKVAVPTYHFENIMIAEAARGDGYGPCEPSIVVNPTNTKNIAAGAILDRNYWSLDGGKTWSSDHIKSNFGVFGDPVLAADYLGNIFFAHLSDPEKGGWSSPKLLDCIVIQKSTDGGKTYDNGSTMGNRHPKDQDKHWIFADPKTHTLLCSWTEFDKYNSHDLEKDHSRILFSQSKDHGKTWSDALVISQFEGDCEDDDNTTEGAVPTTGPNGEYYVAWSFQGKIWFDRSLDGGKTWLDKDIIVASQPGGWAFDIPGITRCNGMPVLVCDLSDGPNKGTLYVNWSDQRNGLDDTDIWFSKSTDGGNSWSKPKRVNDDDKGKHQFLHWMAIDQVTGNLYCIFYDRRNYTDENTDVYLAISADGGKTFENHLVSTAPFKPNNFVFFGDYNGISAHNGTVRPIWTRMDKSKLSVWTALIDFPVSGK